MKSVLEAIGNTPLVPLKQMPLPNGCRLFAKIEFLNPSGSIKDRIVHHIITDAEKKGQLQPGATIVEHTSGNTGAALALLAAQKGYDVIVTIPDKVSVEKQRILRVLGAEVIVCRTEAAPGTSGHYVQRAHEIHVAIPGSFMLNQYDNPKNADAHYVTTGPEIWRQAKGRISVFIAAGSTGGTLSGAGRYLKERDSGIRVILADPKGSIYFKYFKEGVIDPGEICPYQVEGVGESHLAKCMDFSVIDDVIQFTDAHAFSTVKALATREGLLCGGSSGANVWAAMQVAKQMEDATIVTVLPDSGVKYLSKIGF